jgi:hypothetical protein
MRLFSNYIPRLSATIFVALLATLVFGGHAHADSYNGSDLIDNNIFLNSTTMNQSSIQSFLNGQGGWLAAQTFATPSFGNQSAAWIINYVSQDVGINPQVIMATMQKEETLITDPSPDSSQYNYAMGYDCPDGGSCGYTGFYNQVWNGSWQLRLNYERANGNNGSWTAPDGNVLGSGYSYACGSSTHYYSTGLYPGRAVTFYDDYSNAYATITLANAATAALYCYTPHVYPGSSQEYYSGSYNFVESFISWWGTVHDDLSVIQESGGSQLFIDEGGRDKRWIPGTDVLDAWGLQNYNIQVLSAGAWNALPTLPQISRVVNGSANVYFMDNGESHYIPSQAMWNVWGLGATTQVGDDTIGSIPSGGTLGRYMQVTGVSNSDPNYGKVWLADDGSINYVPNPTILGNWSFDQPVDLTYVSEAFLDSKTQGPNLSSTVSAGGKDYQLIAGYGYAFPSTAVATDWGATSFVSINSDPLDFIYTQTASPLVETSSSGGGTVYLMDNGELRGIPTADLLSDWGYGSQWNITRVDPSYLSGLSTLANVSYIAEDSSTNNVYVLDGAKHLVPNANVQAAWTTSGQTIDNTYADNTLSLLPSGANAGTIVQQTGNGRVYVLNRGKLLYVPDYNTLDAWGYTGSNLMFVGSSLMDQLTSNTGGTVPNASTYVYDGTTDYLFDHGTKHSVSTGMATQWALSSPVTVDPTTTTRMTTAGALASFASVGSNTYLMDQGTLRPVGSYSDAWGASGGNTVALTSNYFGIGGGPGSYLVQGAGSGQVFLLSGAQKYYINTFDKLIALGYPGVPVEPISATALTDFTQNSNNASIFVNDGSGNNYLLDAGSKQPFANTAAQAAWGSTSGTQITLSPSILAHMATLSAATQTARSSNGSVFFISGGIKQYIGNPTTYYNTYASYGLVQISDYTLDVLPNGANIN